MTLALQTSPVSFTCVDLDWWPETKCDYGRCTWGRSSMLTIELDDRRLRAALRALSPSFLRLGGSLSDFVRYEVADTGAADAAGCNASFGGPTLGTRLGFPVGAGCLKASRWDAAHLTPTLPLTLTLTLTLTPALTLPLPLTRTLTPT